MEGYFNVILHPREKKEGLGWSNIEQCGCNNFVKDSGLLEVSFKRGDFTWTNRHNESSNIVEILYKYFVSRYGGVIY